MSIHAKGLGAPILCLFLACPAQAQEADVFSFIPEGGRSILEGLLGPGLPPATARDMLAAPKKAGTDWLGQFETMAAAPGLKAMDSTRKRTLADYLATNFPLPEPRLPATASAETIRKALPPDGRDLILQHCQSCHIITVVVTQARTREAWLGTMNKPSHIEIKTSKQEREEIATYLVINAGIPIDLVPEELRAGGATY